MDIEKLEKLSKLKEKGIITQEEFEQQKKEILDDEVSGSDGFSWKNVVMVCGVLIVVIIAVISLFSENVNFACDESSMKQAQSLLNNHFLNWNGSLRLSNPTTVSQSSNHIRCKVNSNIREFAVIYYNLEKQQNGEILISSNPVGDALDEVTKDFEQSMRNLFQ